MEFLLVFFTFIISLMEALIQEHSYRQIVLLDRLLMYVEKIVVCHAFLPSRSLLISFRSLSNGNCLFSSPSLHLAGDINSSMHKFRVMPAAKQHLNAT